MTSLGLIQFSTYFSTSFISTAIFANWFSILQMSFSYIFFFPPFLLFLCLFLSFFSLLMEGYKKDMVFQLSESLVPCASLFSRNIGKSTFLCCLSINSDCFLAALIFSLKASASSECFYLVASHLHCFPPFCSCLTYGALALPVGTLSASGKSLPMPLQKRIFPVFYHISPHYHIPIHHFSY